MDTGIVDNVSAAHTASYSGVDDDGADEVADIGCLSAGGVNAYALCAELLEEFLRAVYDGRDDLTGDEALVAAYCRGEKNIVRRADAEEVVDVHDEGVLGYAFPDGEVAGLAPVDVCERALCSCAVGVHDVAPVGVAAEIVGDNLAESSGENTLVDVLDCVVDVFL